MDEEIIDGTEETTEPTEPAYDQPSEGRLTISADLIRGHINTIILRTLYERDKYGYEIIEEIETKSHGQYTLKQPTLYSALKRLESQGYIKAYWKTDEVSLGGRRKYFTLTELGREFSEKNQSEWEYSRTVIDSLISDKPFDFSKPAPSEVDFNLLRQSVTRVPTGDKTAQSVDGIADGTTSAQSPAHDKQSTTQDDCRRAYIESVETSPVRAEYTQQITTEVIIGKKPEETVTTSSEIRPETRSEEEQRRAHENYIRLITPPPPAADEKPAENTVPHSDEIDTSRLIYNNKPATERDYKTLINNIFVKALKNNPQQAQNQSQQQTVGQHQVYQQNFNQPQQIEPVVEKAKTDGLKVKPSTPTTTRSNTTVKTTYNVGSTLFASSAIIGLIFLLEFVGCLLYKDTLAVTLAYPITILAIGVAQFLIFSIFALSGFGKNSSRPTQHNYVSVSIILTIIAILIICLVGFLLNVNVNSLADVLTKLIIPSLLVLNLPIFTITYYLQAKYR